MRMTKKERRAWKKDMLANKRLCKKYPWLRLRNWYGKLDKDGEYQKIAVDISETTEKLRRRAWIK